VSTTPEGQDAMGTLRGRRPGLRRGESEGRISARVLLQSVQAVVEPPRRHQLFVGPGLDELAPVQGTPFDFTSRRTIAKRIGTLQAHVEDGHGGGYDLNYVVDGTAGEMRLDVFQPVTPIAAPRRIDEDDRHHLALPGLDERQRLEAFVVSSESTGEECYGVRLLYEDDFSSEEVDTLLELGSLIGKFFQEAKD